MKKRRLLLILLGFVAVTALAVLIWPRKREPEYDGVPTSVWLEKTAPREDFARAIKCIGTNGLPVLVRSVDFQMPYWRYWLRCKIAPKLPKAVVGNCPVQSLLGEKALHRANAAVLAFEILGRDALPALDDLRQIADRSGPSSFAGHAILTLTLSKSGDFDEGRSR